MKSGTANRLKMLALIIPASCVIVSLTAGEAIQFSNAKTKPEPGVQNKLAKDKLSTLERIPSSNPFDAVNAAGSVRDGTKRQKTREEKRRELAELEKKNWTQVEKGELQEEEDEKTAFGVRDYDVETAGREKTATDIWLGTKNNNRRTPGNSRAPGASSRESSQNRPRPTRESDEVDGGLKIGKSGGKQTDQPLAGPQPSNERSLQGDLGLEPASGKLYDIFGGPPEDQNRRGDLGLRSIETPPAARAPGLGGGDALGFGRDPGARPALSGSPSQMDSPRSQSSSPFAPPGSSPGLSGSRFGTPASGDGNLTPRGFGGTPSFQSQPRNSFTPASSTDFSRPTRPSSGR